VAIALILFFAYGTLELDLQLRTHVVIPAPGWAGLADAAIFSVFAVTYRWVEFRMGVPVGGPRSGAAFLAMIVGFGTCTFAVVSAWAVVAPLQYHGYDPAAATVISDAARRVTIGNVAWWLMLIAGSGLAVFDLVLAIPAPESWEEPPPPEPLVQDRSDDDGTEI
jgi:hypothetical protein